jgi:hypothetical protein
MKCLIFGGSGEVGSAVSRGLIRSDVCSGLTMLGRRTVTSFQDEAKAFVAHLEKRVALQNEPLVSYGNKEMKSLLRE